MLGYSSIRKPSGQSILSSLRRRIISSTSWGEMPKTSANISLAASSSIAIWSSLPLRELGWSFIACFFGFARWSRTPAISLFYCMCKLKYLSGKIGRESVIGCNFDLWLHLASLDADFDDGSRLELVHKIDLCMRVLKSSTYFWITTEKSGAGRNKSKPVMIFKIYMNE